MALPVANEFSTVPHPSRFLAPRDIPKQPLKDWSRGGVALNDSTDGLDVYNWRFDYDKKTFKFTTGVPDLGTSIDLYTTAELAIDVSGSFDTNMQPVIAWVTEDGDPWFRWFDPIATAFVNVALPAGSYDIRVCLDDPRQSQQNAGVPDTLITYLRGDKLYFRQLRDRFEDEYELATGLTGASLGRFGMNSILRMQWEIFNTSIESPLTTASVPFLADVVRDLCIRAGVPEHAIDVSELYDDLVPGYMINRDSGVDEWLKPLTQFYFFDPTEYDRKLHFYKRGRDVVMGISHRDLVQTNNASDPMKMKIVDTSKLPRTVSVSHLDPTGNYARNKQTAERKSNLVKSKANKNMEANLVLSADQAASIALQTLKVAWFELMEFAWELPIGYSVLVPGDVFNFFAKDGSTQRIRITTKNEDGNILKFEGVQDGGVDVYKTTATGNILPFPGSSTPGLVGETRLEVLNIPVLLDQDDELGIYVAMAGETEAWFGAQLQFSTDGVTYAEALQNEIPATIGDTVTALAAEVSAEYPSVQEVTVDTLLDLESITEESLLNNGNRAVIGDEIVQFQTATFLGTVAGKRRWKLTNLIRARYNTEPQAWPIGTRFVLLDSAVTFLRAQQWMLGMELWFKPVSFGVSDDTSVPTSYDFDPAYSQLEWAPTGVEAVRDGSDNVTVTWIPRPRLGVETAPRQSKYFTGYRVTFSDGPTFDTTAATYVRNATPVGVTVHVAGLNSITGQGELSEEIAT